MKHGETFTSCKTGVCTVARLGYAPGEVTPFESQMKADRSCSAMQCGPGKWPHALGGLTSVSLPLPDG